MWSFYNFNPVNRAKSIVLYRLKLLSHSSYLTSASSGHICHYGSFMADSLGGLDYCSRWTFIYADIPECV
uniref:Uncharacterized protein n=1 Tax=Arion vulgaris TaxID=1028688 RepID=A0A0B6Z3S1_9EUPU